MRLCNNRFMAARAHATLTSTSAQELAFFLETLLQYTIEGKKIEGERQTNVEKDCSGRVIRERESELPALLMFYDGGYYLPTATKHAGWSEPSRNGNGHSNLRYRVMPCRAQRVMLAHCYARCDAAARQPRCGIRCSGRLLAIVGGVSVRAFRGRVACIEPTNRQQEQSARLPAHTFSQVRTLCTERDMFNVESPFFARRSSPVKSRLTHKSTAKLAAKPSASRLTASGGN
jgi:hypothetical protein